MLPRMLLNVVAFRRCIQDIARKEIARPMFEALAGSSVRKHPLPVRCAY
jgi:hypothetical protein